MPSWLKSVRFWLLAGWVVVLGLVAWSLITYAPIGGLLFGFGVTIAPLFEFDGEPVSSSRIRELIRLKYVEDASRLLGRPPSLEGEVVRGDGRGRELGVPTANLGMTTG